MELHPDTAKTGCSKTNAQKFASLAEAYETLSNEKERRRYDFHMQDRLWYQDINRNRRGHGSGSYSDMRPSPEGPKATGIYKVLETWFRPRNFLLGITFGFCSVMAYQSFLNEARKKKFLEYKNGKQLVEAWKNPATGRWEQAAPWDPTYRRLKPTLELVPREQVQSRPR